jgi:hypothetical protein
MQALAGTLASLVGGGNETMCGLSATGTTECWGQVSPAGSSTPVGFNGMPVVNALGAFDSTTICGLAAADGSVWCFTLGSSGAPAEVTPQTDGG